MKKLSKKERAILLVKQMVEREGSVDDFCKKIGVSHPLIYDFYESGKMSYYTADKIISYCQKNKIKISMSDIKTDTNIFSK